MQATSTHVCVCVCVCVSGGGRGGGTCVFIFLIWAKYKGISQFDGNFRLQTVVNIVVYLLVCVNTS